MQATRSGTYALQPGGFRAFIPASLSPDPPLAMSPSLLRWFSAAAEAVGRLDGITATLPNPDLFVTLYARQEAVLSCQIEGTQSTFEDVVAFEVTPRATASGDLQEVLNYIAAMRHGLERLSELPLCLRLIREIHERLLYGVRGEKSARGEFRRIQNWIGSPGCTVANADFVPPPPQELPRLLDEFEGFLHDDTLPPLIHCALAHAQFETLHPFLDGNGRLGRLLITLLLRERKVLREPLLYLSAFFRAHRPDYYEALNRVRQKDGWEGWVEFFLQGVQRTSESAAARARAILDLQERHRQVIGEHLGRRSYAAGLHELLLRQPIVTSRLVREELSCTAQTAIQALGAFEELGLLRETTGARRNQRYRYDEYLRLFEGIPDDLAAPLTV